MSDLIGKSIGQYQIVEKIGTGGMATVYKAYQPAIDRYIAVKILPRQLAKDPNFVKRFQHEAKAIAALEHPHILPVHDFGTDEGYTYMVMRYVEGGTLADLMGQALSSERITQIVSNVARALDYAHQQGVVHRDIKPSNILIDQHDEVLLTDFGIAKMIEGTGDTQLTSAGSILGTPAYMAPEQAEAKPVDGRTDIYALGVVLYELLTGQPPYRAETPLAVVLKHLNEPLPPPRTVKADVPEPFERVVLKAMAKEPVQRFQTAADMEKALRQALKEIESSPATAQIASPVTQTEGRAIRPEPTGRSKSSMMPLLVIGGIVALLFCVAGAGAVTWVLIASSDEVGRVTPTPVERSQATPPAAGQPSSTPTGSPPLTPTPPPPSIADGTTTSLASYLNLEGNIVLEEDFSTNQRGWFVGEEEDEYGYSEARVIDGRYRLRQEADQPVMWWTSLDDADFGNFVLSVEVVPVEQTGPMAYGLIFRNEEDDSLYIFEVDSDGYFFVDLLTEENRETLIDFTETPLINQSGPNQLGVKAAGPQLSFFINNREVAALEDDTIANGSIGVVIELYEAGSSATIEFDDVVVQEIDADTQPDEPDGEILFEEYFESDANGWATGEFEDEYSLDEITIEDGEYILNITARQAAYIEKKLPNKEFSDFALSVEATPHDTEEHYSYGVAFRLNDNSYGYTFEIGNDGLYTVLLYEDGWTSLKEWSSTEAINVGETNEIEIIAAGSILSFFVNGEELTTLEDDTVASGQIGLVLDMLEDETSATVSFDNLVIEAVDDSP